MESLSGAPEAKKRGRARLIMWAVLAAVALGAVVVVGPTAWRVADQHDTSVVLPESIGNLVRDDSAQATDTAEYLLSALQAALDLETGAGAVYTDPEEGPASSIILAVGTATLFTPERELDSVLQLLTEGTGAPVSWQDMPAGERGGALKCGLESDGEAGDIKLMTICGWADHGSIALALLPDRDVDEAAALLLNLRSATLSR